MAADLHQDGHCLSNQNVEVNFDKYPSSFEHHHHYHHHGDIHKESATPIVTHLATIGRLGAVARADLPASRNSSP